MAINPGTNLNSVPAPAQQTLASNYLDLSSASNAGWGQQYVPDLMEKEAEVFGPRTISGFLSQVGAEEAMTADQVVWSEQGRLHLSYKGAVDSQNVITIQSDIDGNDGDGNTANGISTGASTTQHGIRENDTLLVANANGVFKCLVKSISGDDITVRDYNNANLDTATTDGGTTVLVYGSEFAKGKKYDNNGTADGRGANEPQFNTFTNKPIILKDYYEVSGSDASRIGWVEVTSEMGQSGYLWYLKAESDTRARFNDYLEMSMLEHVRGSNSTTVDTELGAASDAGVGTQGLFDAIEDRGNVTTGVTGVNAATDLAEFDAILAEFDKQGAIEEYMMFINRATSLAVDDMLASMNSYGAGGTSYGVLTTTKIWH